MQSFLFCVCVITLNFLKLSFYFRTVSDLQNYCKNNTGSPHIPRAQFLLLLTSDIHVVHLSHNESILTGVSTHVQIKTELFPKVISVAGPHLGFHTLNLQVSRDTL